MVPFGSYAEASCTSHALRDAARYTPTRPPGDTAFSSSVSAAA